jgi:hypothetical protein
MSNVKRLSPKAPTWIVRKPGIAEFHGTNITVRLERPSQILKHNYAFPFAVYIGDERWRGSNSLADAKKSAEAFHEELIELKIIEA